MKRPRNVRADAPPTVRADSLGAGTRDGTGRVRDGTVASLAERSVPSPLLENVALSSHEHWLAWLDEWLAEWRRMAIQAGIAYHRERLADLAADWEREQ